MSLHSYHVSSAINRKDPPFYAIIMAAMRKADTDNSEKLRAAFPDVYRELKARYNAPLGVIPEDGDVDMEILAEQIKAIGASK